MVLMSSSSSCEMSPEQVRKLFMMDAGKKASILPRDDTDVSMCSEDDATTEYDDGDHGDDDSSCTSSDDDDDSNSSYWSDDEEDSEGDVQMLELIRTLPRLASAPAFFNTIGGGGMSSPLISKAVLQKQNMMRADSTCCLFNTLECAPASLMERVRASELVIGTGDAPTSTSSTTPIVPRAVTPIVGLQQSEQAASPKKHCDEATASSSSPQALYLKLLHELGFKNIVPINASDAKNLFLDITPEHVAGYDMAKAAALRTEDIPAFRDMMQNGESLQVCNRFGESIVHSICRRGSDRLLQFFLNEAQVSLKVVDDYGRNPMHDACWTVEPKFAVVERVLTHCPDLLLIADKRGCSPLDYVPKEHWALWCQFLNEHQNKLMPREIAVVG